MIHFMQNMRYEDPAGPLELPDGSWFYWKLIIALFLLAWPAREKFILGKELNGNQKVSVYIGMIMIWNYFWAIVNYLLPLLIPAGIIIWHKFFRQPDTPES